MTNFQMTKDEIENFMDKITDDIRNIDVEKGDSKAPSPQKYQTQRDPIDCGLAKSTLKGLEHGKKHLTFLKNAIGKSVKPGSKNPVSPRVLLRANTLIDYQA